VSRAGDALRDALQTALRLLPWPTEPGLRRSGRPDEWSPVVVTGNYDLTVRRVLRGLAGRDAWVVVAPSGGINVWCASSGGHLSTHQVVTALKTSGVAERVRHRRAILPQLAATGVQARDVSRRCGWRTRFGPVYAEDLPAYLDAGQRKTDAMRRVRFGARQRVEMAAAWAAPGALVAGGIAALCRAGWGLPVAGLAAVIALATFALYDRLPRPPRLWLAGGALALALAATTLAGGDAAARIAALVSTLGLTALCTFDYAGSTPIEGGSHFRERHWHVALDLERCAGVFTCTEVCPEACFERERDVRKVAFAYEERCIRCGACIVQCPQDALAFEDEDGRRIEPDEIRRFKLDLLGRRTRTSA
jgi:NAD-dependent dihydropyrimidine dehydrogenase PreA subunit